MLNQAGSTLPFAEAGSTTRRAIDAGTSEPFVEFERMVLRNLFEIPASQPRLGNFGTGPPLVCGVRLRRSAGGCLRQRRRHCIASTLAAGKSGGEEQQQWPYFRTTKIEAFTG